MSFLDRLQGNGFLVTLNISLGVTGFYVHVDDNGDSEFNMTLLDFVQKVDGELGEFCLSLKNLYKAGNL